MIEDDLLTMSAEKNRAKIGALKDEKLRDIVQSISDQWSETIGKWRTAEHRADFYKAVLIDISGFLKNIRNMDELYIKKLVMEAILHGENIT